MNIVGLGNAGCNIAKKFEEYPQYSVYQIDSEARSGENTFLIRPEPHPEDYERNCPNLKSFLNLKGDVTFIMSGSGLISGASLAILEQIKECSITIIYLKSDPALLSELNRLHQRATFHIMQEYARSGVFREVILLDNHMISDIVGDVPIVEYYNSINSVIVSVVHFLNVFKNTKPVMSTFSNESLVNRIKTVSILDLKSDEEKFLFSLDNPKEARYYYGISRESLAGDSTLNSKIRKQMKQMKTKTSFGVYETNYNHNFCYGEILSSEITSF